VAACKRRSTIGTERKSDHDFDKLNDLFTSCLAILIGSRRRNELRGINGYTSMAKAAHRDFQGRGLNRPNDVVVKSDGAIYFTDPRPQRTGGISRTRKFSAIA
jgi:sugar lactone lactonase YvrE